MNNLISPNTVSQNDEKPHTARLADTAIPHVKIKITEIPHEKIPIPQYREPPCPPPLGTLRSNDADGNENVKTWNNRFHKQNNNFARTSHFFVHFFPAYARL